MTALLECRDLAIGYERPILSHIDLAIEQGEIVALLGGSGSGKSTLLRVVTGLLPPLGGDVRLFGESLGELPPDQRAALLRRTGTAFQQDALFSSLSLAENVALPLRELSDLPEPVASEMVRMRLELVGLAGLESRLPAQLSGGQRKRAALARASILDPELVLCDEPTSGLDPVVAAEIDDTLLEFRRILGTTVVVISHELSSIKTIADRAVLFGDGTIRAAGTIDELARSSDREVHDFFHARTE